MTVAQYIQALQTLPQEADVMTYYLTPASEPEGVRHIHVDPVLGHKWSCVGPDEPCDLCKQGRPLVPVVVL